MAFSICKTVCYLYNLNKLYYCYNLIIILLGQINFFICSVDIASISRKSKINKKCNIKY